MKLCLVLAVAVAFLVGMPGASTAERVLDIDREIRLLDQGQAPPLLFPGARFRVAVFRYEDPDETGLGNALAALLGQELLLQSAVTSIGILRYEGRLAPSDTDPSGYFDKVERLAAAQQVSLALWGIVRRSGDRILIETFAQFSRQAIDSRFAWRLPLPGSMGGGVLTSHLRPDRMLLQRHDLPGGAAVTLQAASQRMNELRAQPDETAGVVASLTVDTVYWVVQKRDDGWVEIETGGARKGWVRATGHCPGDCAPLLDTARFASGLLRFMDHGQLPVVSRSLASDALAVRDQLAAVWELKRGSAVRAEAIVSRWLGGGPVPPGGAAFANLLALSRIAIALKGAGPDRGAGIPPDRVRAIAFELAEASQDDPRNTDVLRNLEVLFQYVGDTDRSQLARQLATEAERHR